jgi:hypothetical protein
MGKAIERHAQKRRLCVATPRTATVRTQRRRRRCATSGVLRARSSGRSAGSIAEGRTPDLQNQIGAWPRQFGLVIAQHFGDRNQKRIARRGLSVLHQNFDRCCRQPSPLRRSLLLLCLGRVVRHLLAVSPRRGGSGVASIGIADRVRRFMADLLLV